jgi:hypothetical protein
MTVHRFLFPLVLLAAAAAAVSSCGEASPVAVDVSAVTLSADKLAPRSTGDDGNDADSTADDTDENEDGDSLVVCRPLPYESVTQTIGPAGGTIEVRRNWLVIPPGALRAPVQITAVAPSDTVALVRFQPEGLRFQTTVLLVATYDNCRVPKGVTPRIARVSDGFHVIEYLAPADGLVLDKRVTKGPKGRHVVGELHHFSNYAVAW